jgi:hypothetical protein
VAINLAYATGSAVSITNSETSLATTGGTGGPQAKTDAGSFMLILDGVANMVKGDEYLLRVYEKAVSGGTQRVIMSARLLNAQSEPFLIPNLLLGVGWDITLQRISASSRAFDWSIRRVS